MEGIQGDAKVTVGMVYRTQRFQESTLPAGLFFNLPHSGLLR